MVASSPGQAQILDPMLSIVLVDGQDVEGMRRVSTGILPGVHLLLVKQRGYAGERAQGAPYMALQFEAKLGQTYRIDQTTVAQAHVQREGTITQASGRAVVGLTN
jgi:hypothetical protein